MENMIIVTSNKDPGGVAFYDLQTGSSVSSQLKNSICGSGGRTLYCNLKKPIINLYKHNIFLALDLIGGTSSYSGIGGYDYIVVSQLNKPAIHIWQIGKHQVQ